ncbi:MAG: hypothetical protein NTX05_05435 [Fusobacteria bacterium]|nr:hypothetical protein [Fusobacteriota bacterium]
MKKIIFILLFIIFTLSLLAQSLSVATFNVQRLGVARKNISYVSQILNLFDITAIQEIQNLRVVEQLQRENPNLNFLVSKVSVGRGYKEYYGFSFNPKNVSLTEIGYYPGSGFMRPPYGAIATVDHNTFLLITVHIQFGKSQLIREQEIAQLPNAISYFTSKEPNIKNIILLGDFNIDSNDTINYLLSPSSTKLFPVLDNSILTTIGKNDYANQYDKIYISKNILSMVTSSGSIQIKNISLEAFKKSISDHRPVFMMLSI